MSAVMSEVEGDKFINSCSCRVWAIDGWEDEAISSAFNNSIATLGTKLSLTSSAKKKSFDEKVAFFLTLQRSPPAKHNKQCIVYGVFDSNDDVTPTHMWLEYDGYIYDTVPGDPLCRKKAGPRNRYHPGCEPHVQPKEMVGAAPTYLTKRQSRVLKAADGSWKAYGRGISTYIPENQVVRG